MGIFWKGTSNSCFITIPGGLRITHPKWPFLWSCANSWWLFRNSCDCPRKCATKACPCLAKRVKCTIKCHTKKRSFVPCTNKWSIKKLGVKYIFFYYELYAVFWGTSSMIGTPSGQWGPSRLLWFKIIPSYITIFAMLTKGSDPDPHLRVRPLPSPSGPCWPSRLLGFKIIPSYISIYTMLTPGSNPDPHLRVWPWPSPLGQCIESL